MIPTLLGNLVGGGLFVSTAYWYLYLTGEGDIQIDFNIGPLNSAVEAGGPTRRTDEQLGNTTAKDILALPHPSGIGELSDNSKYAKSHAERTKSPDSSSDEKV